MKRQLKAPAFSPTAKNFVDRLENTASLIRKWHRSEYEEHFLRVSICPYRVQNEDEFSWEM